MRNAAKAIILFLLPLAVWMGLATLNGVSLVRMAKAKRPWAGLNGQPKKGANWLLWLGDSVSFACPAEPGDKAQGDLLTIVKACLKARSTGKDLSVVDSVSAGQCGLQYEATAYRCARLKPAASTAVITFNARAFYPMGGFQRGIRPLPPEEAALPSLDWDQDPWAPELGSQGGDKLRAGHLKWTLGPLSVWTRETLTGLLLPLPQRASGATATESSIARANATAGLPFRVIYGQGAKPDLDVLEALVRAGRRLRRVGAKVTYLVVPMDWVRLREELTPEETRHLEAFVAKSTERLRAEGFKVLDQSHLLRDGFYEPPSEHLRAFARRELAGLICQALP